MRPISNFKRQGPLGTEYLLSRRIGGLVYRVGMRVSESDMTHNRNFVAFRLRMTRKKLAAYIKANKA